MFFCSQYKVKMFKELSVLGADIGEWALVPFADEMLSLGVVLDSSLTWKPHIKVLCQIWHAIYDPKKCILTDLHQTLQIDFPLLDPYFLKIWMNSLVSFRFYLRPKFDISLSLYMALTGGSNSSRSLITLYFGTQTCDSTHFATTYSSDSTLRCTSFFIKNFKFFWKTQKKDY